MPTIPGEQRFRLVLTFLPLLIAVLVQWSIRDVIHPYVWALFYPALYVSTRLGDRRSGLIATAISTAAVWLLFIRPEPGLRSVPRELFGTSVFAGTGILFTLFHDRVRKIELSLSKAIEERRVFAALVDSCPDFVGISDARGKPLYVNPAGRQMIGLSADYPVESTSILEYFPPDQRSFASSVIVKSIVEQGHWEGETYFRNWRSQTAVPVSSKHFTIREPATRRILGAATVARDISDIKRAQEEVESANRRLQQDNENVMRLFEKTKELDELKTRFFANLGHEFRTPVTLILGPIEKHLASPEALDPALRRDLEVVERNARTILRHVNDMLDAASFDAGRLTLEYADADVAALVRMVAGHFTILANEKNIRFTIDARSTLQAQVDSDRLRRILLNLLSNAFKFTPVGGRIRISLRDAGSRFLVEVADSGPGVPVSRRKEVFEHFRKFETGETRHFTGTGLGLSIVKDFATLLGGRVSIADAPEGGALFVLELPCSAPAGTPLHPPTNKADEGPDIEQLVKELREPSANATAEAPLESARDPLVLVVEDHVDMNRLIAQSLTDDGFRVVAAFDGREGYEKAIEHRPDLVVTDIMMPTMRGDELVNALRERPELNSMPIIVLTAIADHELRIRLLRQGAQDYLDKPFSVEELRTRTRNLVARKRAEEESNRLRRQFDDVARASASVSEAIARLPETSVQAVLQTIALNARTLLSCEFAAVGVGGDPGGPFEIFAFAGIDHEQSVKIGRFPRRVGLLDLVTKENKAVRLADLREHPEYRGMPADHPVMTSFLAVPIRYRDRVQGNLYLANKLGSAEFTEQDTRLLERLAARVGVAIEIARLYAAEGRQREWLQAVVDQMPNAVVLMDASGRLTAQNQSTFSLTSAELEKRDRFGNPVMFDLRHPSGEMLSPDDLPIVRAILHKETTHGQELVARRADGRLVPLMVSAAPIVTARAELAGAVMILQDVSALKELERLREEWSSIVVHDLRQPITSIVLKSDLLLRADLGDEPSRHVRQILTAAKRLSRMVSDLMDASLLESHRLKVDLNRLDLGELVRDVVDRTPEAARRTTTRIPDEHRVYVKGDAQRLEQVLTNLLSNAVKYGAPDTEIRVDVTAHDGNAEMLVTNHGPGISGEETSLIFQRYSRSRATTSGTPKGAGLGLYIAKGLVEAHGGRIWVESVPDAETTFHVTIPLDDSSLEPVAGQYLTDDDPSRRESTGVRS